MPAAKLPIPSAARVLEIGSGHNPHPRADVLCDRYADDRERAGALRVDRPFVLASGEALPFAPAAFDYVIAVHVLEHADSIETFIGELERVGRAGYIESPSAIGERLFGWRKHRWQLIAHEGTLYVKRRPPERQFGSVFHELMRRDAQWRAIYYRYPDLFLARLQWNGHVPYRMLGPEDPDPVDLDDPAAIERLLSQQASPGSWLRAYVPVGLRDRLWRFQRDQRAAWRSGGRVPRS